MQRDACSAATLLGIFTLRIGAMAFVLANAFFAHPFTRRFPPAGLGCALTHPPYERLMPLPSPGFMVPVRTSARWL